MITDLALLEKMNREGVNLGLESATTPAPVLKDCFKVPIPCELISREQPGLPPVLSLYYEFGDDEVEEHFENITNNQTTISIIPPNGTQFQSENFTANNMDNYNNSTNTTDLFPPDNSGQSEIETDTMLHEWLRNLTSQSPEENCDSCLSRCGHNCFDLCHVLRDCSEDPQMRYRSSK